LKGHPKGRLTAKLFDEMRPQVSALVEQPIVYPGVPGGHHRSYLVTNGEVEEEVQRAVDDLNRSFLARGFSCGLEIWARGWMLQAAQDLGTALWPSELEDVNRLLELLIADGRTPFPVPKLSALVEPLLGLADKTLKQSSLRRAIPSAAVLTAVALRRFASADNHVAVVTAWTTFIAAVIGACERAGLDIGEARGAIEIAKGSILDALADLFEEAKDKAVLLEGDGLTDFIAIEARILLVRALVAVYWFWREDLGWPSAEEKCDVEAFLHRPEKRFVWGEGAIPQVLAHWFWTRANTGSWYPDLELAALTGQIASVNGDSESNGLPSPYLDYEATLKMRLPTTPEHDREDTAGTSYYVEGLFHLVVLAGLKRWCKTLWPSVSKMAVHEFVPRERWQSCRWRSPQGENVTRFLAPSQRWVDLLEQVRDVRVPSLPAYLTHEDNRHLLMLFLIVFPHRASSALIRRLGRFFNRCWFAPEAIL
jgi:hypothetical protein